MNELKAFYPDVLGAVTGGARITLESLQFAVGLFPKQVFLNQPFEVAVVLQNLTNSAMQVKVALQLPTTDKKGGVAVIDSASPQTALKLRNGEVGILHIPIIVRPPTQPNKDFPIRVAVRYRTEGRADIVRPVSGGQPPSFLSVSPFKLQVFKEIPFNDYAWNGNNETATLLFDLAPKNMPSVPQVPKARYETLWTSDEMQKELLQVKARADDARELAQSARYESSYLAFRDVTGDFFAERGIPLHPGEAMAIANMMAYALDEEPALNGGLSYDYEKTRWFPALCQVLAHNISLKDEWERNELFANFVYSEVLYEAIALAFQIVQPKVKENLGSKQERDDYINRFLQWWGGRGEPDLTFVYLPLVLGGVTINRLVRHMRKENAWEYLDAVSEAMQGRIRLADNAHILIFDMLTDLLDQARAQLRAQRIDRP